MQLTEDVLRTFGMGRVFKVLALADSALNCYDFSFQSFQVHVPATELSRPRQLNRLSSI